jgi:hypothetical protein
VTLFVQHLRPFDSVGKMLHLGYCWHQMHCGNSYPLLRQPSPNLHHAPIGFFSLLQTFLFNTDITIHPIPTLIRLPKPLCRGDLNLSDSFDSLGWKGPKCRLLNYCRLFLLVETLSELCNLDGSSLLLQAWQGQPLSSKSTLLWPNQEHPNSWAPWRQALAKLFLHDPLGTYRNANNLPLRSRLGRWLPNHSKLRIGPSYQCSVYLYIGAGRSYLGHRDTLQGHLPLCLFDSTPVGRHHNRSED